MVLIGSVLMILSQSNAQNPPPPNAEAPSWSQCGWGGGGFYYAAAFHPTQNGVIYLGGDVSGIAKSEDHGRNFRMINRGLAGYGVFSIAVDQNSPHTVYAATEDGLCKSVDDGEHWTVLPQTGRKELRITGEKSKSIRAIAVDPTDSNVVYAASPAGKVYKSTDGGQTWKVAYEKKGSDETDALRMQFGSSNAQQFGGIWLPIKFPEGAEGKDCVGIGFSFKGDGTEPQQAHFMIKTAAGVPYLSANHKEWFKNDQWQDVILKAEDFTVDPEFAKKNPDAAAAKLDLSTVARVDFSWVGNSPTEVSVAKISRYFFAVTHTADGQTGTADKPILLVAKKLSKTETLQTYGNIHLGDSPAGTIYSVAVSPKDPRLVIAATQDSGLVLSRDAGETWTELATPKKASSVSISTTEPDVIFASFFKDGIWKSTDKGQTWVNVSNFIKDCSIIELSVSPTNALDVQAIGGIGWGGFAYSTNDGGKTWRLVSSLKPDSEGDPTLPQEGRNATPISAPTNIAINPLNPQEVFISANWRSCLSEDGGATWTERNRGADISCITDIRFHKGRTYTTVMDEGTLVSDNAGVSWKQLWPLKYDGSLGGHNWRVAIADNNGVDRIVSTVAPWDVKYTPRVVTSDDGGKTYDVVTAGLPDYIVKKNTMWGVGHPRALAVDPNHRNVLYMGIDGDATEGKSGGGIFKSEDAGSTWTQLPNQPASRRMYYGLAVDPTDSNRIFWATCGVNGGLHSTDDGGATWKNVFANEQWLWNVLVTADGTVYCSGQNLWRSTDHGATWKQISNFKNGRAIVGLEADPRNPNTLWISATTWDGSSNGGVYKTVDGGVNWQDITGNIPCVKPQILRFNPETNELWAGWVGLFKIKQ